MNSNAFFSRVEILFYSSLISTMSGISRIRHQIRHLSTSPLEQYPSSEAVITQTNLYPEAKPSSINWEAIKESLISLFLWAILGFSVGFLLGMIKPW